MALKGGLINLSIEAMGPLGISSLLSVCGKRKGSGLPFLSGEESASFTHLC